MQSPPLSLEMPVWGRHSGDGDGGGGALAGLSGGDSARSAQATENGSESKGEWSGEEPAGGGQTGGL